MGFAAGRINIPWPRGAQTTAQDVGADNEKAPGVKGQAGADHGLPPAAPAGHRVGAGNILIPRQGMADQDGVGLFGIQFTVGLIGHGDGGQGAA